MPGFLDTQLRRLTDHYDPHSLASGFRQKRFATFLALLEGLPRPVTILDIGGDPPFWDAMRTRRDDELEITILNLSISPAANGRYKQVLGDARCMPFLPTRKFDVVFSNSVVEHLGSFGQQKRMAEEVVRVGKRFFIQTPCKCFPVEPHFLFPAFQFLPFPWRVWIASHYSAGWYCRPGDPAGARTEVSSIRLLTRSDCSHLFPGATILVERLLGLAKSYLIIGGWGE